MRIADGAAFAAALRASRDELPIKDRGNDRYRLQIDREHAGWPGLLRVTGKGPFEPGGAGPAAWQPGERLA